MDEQTDGYKFAVALLVAFSVVFFKVYDYFQTTSVDEKLYESIIMVLSSTILILLCLVVYIFLKGYCFEMYNPVFFRLARMMYMMAFLLSFLFLVYWLCSVVFKVEVPTLAEITEIVQLYAILFLIIVIFIAFILPKLFKMTIKYVIKFSHRDNKEYLIEFLTVMDNIFSEQSSQKDGVQAIVLLLTYLWLLFISLIILSFLFIALLNSPLQGNIVIDMENLYCENDAQIPVFIKVTGLNTGLLINLSKENSEHILTRIDSIKLEPMHNPEKTASGENLTLVGNALDYGNYNVFINTTDLAAGYYEIVCMRKDECVVKGFYILNNSHQLQIK